jgi:aspartyl-tRNA(Asn)/glutamyl-tRNA(Gln) amidotransferase subunit C
MRLSREEVLQVAELARLGLTNDEVERLRDQLSTILNHISELDQLDTNAIPPTAQVVSMINIWREDVVRPSLSVEQVLENAPRQLDHFFLVDTPFVDEEGGS